MKTNSASKAFKERPILFRSPMVRALLAGRKTQARCVVKLPHNNSLGEWQPTTIGGPEGGRTTAGDIVPEQGAIWHTRTGDCLACPYGQPGDRLWVRETWQGPLFDPSDWDAYREDPDAFKSTKYCHYAADSGTAPEFINSDDELVCRWQSSTCMPRWASRITLEITEVRIERLHDISQADAANEGLYLLPASGRYVVQKGKQYFGGADHDARVVFAEMWDRINGAGAWDVNPRVWVVKFKRIDAWRSN